MVKKKTHEEYVDEVTKINPNIEVIGKYIGNDIKIAHRCKIDGCEWETYPSSIVNKKTGCPKCTQIKNKIKTKRTYEEYITELKDKNLLVDIIGEYINCNVKSLFRCKLCGHEWYARPYDILKGKSRCQVCSHKVIGNAPDYKNSMWASANKEYFAQYMSEEQLKSYMPNSNKSIDMKCPDCGYIKHISPNLLSYKGFGCTKCGDGISYPNKFSRAFLAQTLAENICYEYAPNWLIVNGTQRFFDNYFESNGKSYVLEMDGRLGHGNLSFLTGEKDYDGLQIDKEKDRLAQEHSITVIRIDCAVSDKDYIKRNIINSQLPSILCFTENDIDWNMCDKFATSNLVLKAIKLWNNRVAIKQISDKLQVDVATVTRYLKKGKALGLCDYSATESHKRAASRKVIRLSDNRIYNTIQECADNNCLNRKTVYRYCKNKKRFMYYDEYIAVLQTT